MLLLTSTSDLLKIVTSAALALDVHASWVDNASGVITPGRTNTAISTATTTTVVGSPAVSTQRNVQALFAENKDATNPQTVSVQHTDGTTTVNIFKTTLQAGEQLQYVDGVGFLVFTAGGGLKQNTSGFPDLSFLGSLTLGGAAITTGVLTIPAYDELLIAFRITGYSGGDIASLRFNGDAGSNYQTRYLTAAIAGATLTDVFTGTTSLLRLAGSSVTQGRSGLVIVSNLAANDKICAVTEFTEGSAVGTEPVLNLNGGGVWFNTAAQITSVEMRTAGGSITLNAGSGFGVWGRKL